MFVAATNANGEPDLFFCYVRCTSEQYDNGEHYDAAKWLALEEDYEGPDMVAYDEFDPPKAAFNLFEWDTATTFDITNKPHRRIDPENTLVGAVSTVLPRSLPKHSYAISGRGLTNVTVALDLPSGKNDGVSLRLNDANNHEFWVNILLFPEALKIINEAK